MPSPTRALAIAFLLLIATGCSANRGKVTLQGEENRTVFAQSFTQAYIGSGREGEYDIVLVQDPQPKPEKESKKAWSRVWSFTANPTPKPLQPIHKNHLRQVVHIHVFWQAQGGSVARDGVVTNAAIDWYVFANPESDRPDLIHYDGAGYVLLDEGRRATTVSIRDGSMKMANSTGLADPLGPAVLRGTVKAQRNSQLVRATLADLKLQTAQKTAVTQSR